MTSDYLEIKLQKYNLMYIKWKPVIHYWPLVTSNDLLWPLMTSKLKILKLQLYVYQMNLGNFLDMEYIFDLLVTSLKISKLHVYHMKASNSGNLKNAMENILYLLVTSNDP